MIIGTSRHAYSQNGISVFRLNPGEDSVKWWITYLIRQDVNPKFGYVFAFQWAEPGPQFAIEAIYEGLDKMFPDMKNADLRKVNLSGGSMGLGHLILGS